MTVALFAVSVKGAGSVLVCMCVFVQLALKT